RLRAPRRRAGRQRAELRGLQGDRRPRPALDAARGRKRATIPFDVRRASRTPLYGVSLRSPPPVRRSVAGSAGDRDSIATETAEFATRPRATGIPAQAGCANSANTVAA